MGGVYKIKRVLKIKIMIFIIIAAFLNMLVSLYLLNQVLKNRKLINDLAKITKKLAERTLKHQQFKL